MKRLMTATVLLVTMAFLMASCSGEPPSAPPAPAVALPSPEQVEAEIIQLERDWVAAIVTKDVAKLDAILADDFNGTSMNGNTFPKASALEDIQKATYVVESMDMDEVSVNVYGDTAVAFTSQVEKSKYDGKDNSGHYHFTNVWVKRGGRWQVVASHGSPYGK